VAVAILRNAESAASRSHYNKRLRLAVYTASGPQSGKLSLYSAALREASGNDYVTRRRSDFSYDKSTATSCQIRNYDNSAIYRPSYRLGSR